MRDLRDPQILGANYLASRKAGLPIEIAVTFPATNFRSNESCVEKYGKPEDLEPKWMAVQVR